MTSPLATDRPPPDPAHTGSGAAAPPRAAHTPNFDKLLGNSFVVPTVWLGEVAATVRAADPA